MDDSVLYTYEQTPSGLICHAYTRHADGSPIDEADAQAAAVRLKNADPLLGTMVLPAEPLPS